MIDLPDLIAGGFTADVPTDDFWRVKQMRAQEEQQKIIAAQAEKARKQAVMDKIHINNPELDNVWNASYNNFADPIAKELYDEAEKSNGVTTRRMTDLKSALTKGAGIFKANQMASNNLKATPDANLSYEGQTLKQAVESGVDIDKIKSDYAKNFPDSLPLDVLPGGMIDFSPFQIADPNRIKTAMAGIKAYHPISETITPANKENGFLAQKATHFSIPYLESQAAQSKDAAGNTVYSSNIEGIAHRMVQDKSAYKDLLTQNFPEFKKAYQEYASKLNPALIETDITKIDAPTLQEKTDIQQQNIKNKEQAKHEILAQIIMPQLLKLAPHHTAYQSGHQESKGNTTNVYLGNGTQKGEEQSLFTSIQGNASSVNLATVASGVHGVNTKGNTATADQALQKYAAALGLSSDSFQKKPNGIITFNVLTPDGKQVGDWGKNPIAIGDAQVIRDGGLLENMKDYVSKKNKFTDGEIAEFNKHFSTNVTGSLQNVSIGIYKPDGKFLDFKDYTDDPSTINGSRPAVVQSFLINRRMYGDEGNKDLDNLITKLNDARPTSTRDASNAASASYLDEMFGDAPKKYTRQGGQHQPKTTNAVILPTSTPAAKTTVSLDASKWKKK